MKRFFSLMAAATVGVLGSAASASLISEDFESYPVGANSNINLYGYGAVSVFKGQIENSGVGGSKALDLGVNTNASSDPFGGAGIGMKRSTTPRGYGVASTATDLSDLLYSFDAKGGIFDGAGPATPGSIRLMFVSYDSDGNPTSSTSKDFTLDSVGTYQTFSGNLGEGGWFDNTNAAPGGPLIANSASYAFEIAIGDFNGWPLGRESAFVSIDNVSLSVIPEPSTLAALGAASLVMLRRRST